MKDFLANVAIGAVTALMFLVGLALTIYVAVVVVVGVRGRIDHPIPPDFDCGPAYSQGFCNAEGS